MTRLESRAALPQRYQPSGSRARITDASARGTEQAVPGPRKGPPRLRREWCSPRSKVVPASSSTACGSEQAGPRLELDRPRFGASWSPASSKVVLGFEQGGSSADHPPVGCGWALPSCGWALPSCSERWSESRWAPCDAQCHSRELRCRHPKAKCDERGARCCKAEAKCDERGARCRQAEAKCAWCDARCRSPVRQRAG